LNKKKVNDHYRASKKKAEPGLERARNLVPEKRKGKKNQRAKVFTDLRLGKKLGGMEL